MAKRNVEKKTFKMGNLNFYKRILMYPECKRKCMVEIKETNLEPHLPQCFQNDIDDSLNNNDKI